MNITGVILAGGKSSRMGTDKGLVKINSHHMIEYLIQCLKDAGLNRIIIISNNQEYKKFGYPVYTDLIQNCGPLGGIYTALKSSKTKENLVVSCDIPFLDAYAIKALLSIDSESLISVCYHRGRVHGLVGIYNSEILQDLETHLKENKLKVISFLNDCDASFIDIEAYVANLNPNCFENINSLADLKSIENEN